MKKEILRFLDLLAIKSVLILEDSGTYYSSKLEEVFKSYANSIMTILNEIEFFTNLYADAQNFREDNINLLSDVIPSNNFMEVANRNVENILDSTLKPIIDNINNQQKHKDIIFSAIKDAYNVGGQLSIYQVLLQRKININLKKQDEFMEELLEIEDILGVDIADIDINFFLKDPKILEELRGRANLSKYISNGDFGDIKKIIVSDFYEKGEGPRVVAKRLREKFVNMSKSRSELIARTEIHVAQNAAIVAQGNQIGAEFKKWSSMHDSKVRPQHALNDEGGPVRWEFAFAGGPMEYSPDNCESPFHCLVRADTRIYTSKGWVKVQDIKINDLVLTHKGRFRKVERLLTDMPEKYWKKSRDNVVNITVCIPYKKINKKNIKYENRESTLSVTEDHRIYTNKGWVRAKDLDINKHKIYMSGKKCKVCGNFFIFTHRIESDFCSIKCANKNTAINQWKNSKIRSKMVSAISKKNIEQYKDGTRDRFKQTLKANKKCRELAKQGNHIFSRKNRKKEWHEWRFDRSRRTSIEILFESKLLENGMLEGEDFTQQEYLLNRFTVDFYFPKQKIVVEVDGDYRHSFESKKREDAGRDYLLQKNGYTVLRFKGSRLKAEIDECIEELLRVLNNHKGNYKSILTNITEIKKIDKSKSKPHKIYNISVAEDKSYVARGFVVKNCRCVLQILASERPTLFVWDGEDRIFL